MELTMKKILLIGDSIRMGYDKYVKLAFEGEAEVYYPDENCRFAAFVTRNLHEWKKRLALDDVDLVHWNVGLWDDLVLLDGECLTPLPIYCYYIERICRLIKLFFPKAKVIFATSTPIQEKLFMTCKRFNKDTERYNEEAVAIVKRHGFEINDLYSAMVNMPTEYYSDLTHPYTAGGAKLLTEQVVSVIEKALDIKGKQLNYEEFFEKKSNVLGI